MSFQWPELDGAEVVICAPHDGHQWKLHEAYLRQHSTVFKQLLDDGSPRIKKDRETLKPMMKYRLKTVVNPNDNHFATFSRAPFPRAGQFDLPENTQGTGITNNYIRTYDNLFLCMYGHAPVVDKSDLGLYDIRVLVIAAEMLGAVASVEKAVDSHIRAMESQLDKHDVGLKDISRLKKAAALLGPTGNVVDKVIDSHLRAMEPRFDKHDFELCDVHTFVRAAEKLGAIETVEKAVAAHICAMEPQLNKHDMELKDVFKLKEAAMKLGPIGAVVKKVIDSHLRAMEPRLDKHDFSLRDVHTFITAARKLDAVEIAEKHIDAHLRAMLSQHDWELNDIQILARAVETLGRTGTFKKIVDDHLRAMGPDFLRQIFERPGVCASIGVSLCSSWIYKESMIHLVGSYTLLPDDQREETFAVAHGLVIRHHVVTKLGEVLTKRRNMDEHLMRFYPNVMKHPADPSGPTPNRRTYANEIFMWQAATLVRQYISLVISKDMSWRGTDGGAGFYRKISEGGRAYVCGDEFDGFYLTFDMTEKSQEIFEESVAGLKSELSLVVAPLMKCNLEYKPEEPLEYLTHLELSNGDMPWVRGRPRFAVHPVVAAHLDGFHASRRDRVQLASFGPRPPTGPAAGPAASPPASLATGPAADLAAGFAPGLAADFAPDPPVRPSIENNLPGSRATPQVANHHDGHPGTPDTPGTDQRKIRYQDEFEPRIIANSWSRRTATEKANRTLLRAETSSSTSVTPPLFANGSVAQSGGGIDLFGPVSPVDEIPPLSPAIGSSADSGGASTGANEPKSQHPVGPPVAPLGNGSSGQNRADIDVSTDANKPESQRPLGPPAAFDRNPVNQQLLTGLESSDEEFKLEPPIRTNAAGTNKRGRDAKSAESDNDASQPKKRRQASPHGGINSNAK